MKLARQPAVFFAEDNADDRELIRYVFAEHLAQIELRFAADGVLALEALTAAANRDPPALPDVVFLDIRMPRLSGLEVLERLRADARLAHLVVFVLSSSTEIQDIEHAYGAGCAAYVFKSTSFGELEHVLLRACAFGLRLAAANADRGPAAGVASAGGAE